MRQAISIILISLCFLSSVATARIKGPDPDIVVDEGPEKPLPPTPTQVPPLDPTETPTPTTVPTETPPSAETPTPTPTPTITPTATSEATPSPTPTSPALETATSTPVIVTATPTLEPTPTHVTPPTEAPTAPPLPTMPPSPFTPVATPTPQIQTLGEQIVISRVIDGDTFVAERGDREYRVRLSRVDAPDTRQAFGAYAKRMLTRLTLKKSGSFIIEGNDSCGHLLGKLYISRSSLKGRRQLDVGAELVKVGAAWAQRRGFGVESALRKLELKAKRARRGLWEARSPLAPWLFSNGQSCGSGPKPTKAPSQHNERPTKQPSRPSSFRCSGKRTCGEMTSCDEAYHYLHNCGARQLDRDRDGVPCEVICG